MLLNLDSIVEALEVLQAEREHAKRIAPGPTPGGREWLLRLNEACKALTEKILDMVEDAE